MAAVSCTELGTIVAIVAEDVSLFGTLASGAASAAIVADVSLAACSLEVTGSSGGLAVPGSEKAFAEDVVVPVSSTTSAESAFVVPGMRIRLPESNNL